MKNISVNVKEAYLLTVEIFETSRVKERSGVSEKTGKPWNIRTQEAYVNLGGMYPTSFNVRLEEGQPKYPAGRYLVHPGSFKVSEYGDLKVDNVVLVSFEEIKQ
uniref:DNA-Binding protein G5P n=1 Tax=Dulem virus 57 TaxID=3145768 RepID=A0AAU8B508_9VIRU